MGLVQPVLGFILEVHAAGDTDMFDYIENYLTKMVGSRQKMRCAMVFYGKKGAGKDIIFENLFSLFYKGYFLKKSAKGVDTSFNSEFARMLFCLWAEIEISPETVQKMKDMITSKTIQEHAKGKDIMARSCLSSSEF